MSDTSSCCPTLARFLAQAGVASRRASEKLIRDGLVTVNGRVVTDLPVRVDPANDTVICRGVIVRLSTKVYLLLHKPPGYTCSAQDPHAKRLALDLINMPGVRLFSVGRLDRESEGLLLFTNDGDLSQRLSHPRYQVEKVYEVDVRGRVREKDLKRLEQGVSEAGERLTAQQTEILHKTQQGGRIRITVVEGRKREIRRMCRVLGLQVERLVRTRLGPLELGDLAPGTWRHLTKEEVEVLQDYGI